MPTLRNFEEIEAWKKGRALTKSIYSITSQGPFAKDFGLKNQIRRASVSITSNVAEGFERNGNTEFRQFLSVAKGSAGELRTQLYVAYDVGYLTEAQFTTLSNQALEVSKLLSGLLTYLARTPYKGPKRPSPSTLNLEP